MYPSGNSEVKRRPFYASHKGQIFDLLTDDGFIATIILDGYTLIHYDAFRAASFPVEAYTMKVYSVAKTIEATPETIWTILTDSSSYPEWDPGMERIEGRIAPGEKIKVFTKLNPGRTFPVKVTDFVPGQKMTWSGGIPLGLFKCERTFSLSPQGNGTTEFTMREVLSGLLFPMFRRSIPDLTSSFEQFAAGLKSRAKSVH